MKTERKLALANWQLGLLIVCGALTTALGAALGAALAAPNISLHFSASHY